MSLTTPITALSISNVINITLSGLPSGAIVKNVNNLALFTTETPSNADVYRTYIDALSVATDYGTSSVTAAMASAIFAQSPNILSGGGQLIIIPLAAAVAATVGTWTTASIAANLATLIAVTDGYIKVTVNGVDHNLTGLNFSSAATLMDIANLMQRQLVDAIVTVDSTSVPTKLVFKTKKVGSAAGTITVAAGTGSGTSLAGATLFNTAAGTAVGGANASGESISTAITRTLSSVGYCGVITNLKMEDAVITALATTIQALDLIFVHQWSDPTTDIAGAITTIKAATNTKTRCLLYASDVDTANLYKAAYTGRLFSVDFTGSSTVQTGNLKALSGVIPDYVMTQTYWTQAAAAGADIYVNYEGVPCVVSNGANLYFDEVYCRQALKFALQAAGFNYLRQTNTKVPQTESGIEGLKGAYRKVMNQFVTNGYIGAGLIWNSSQTFGDPADFRRNITDFGYFIYSQPIALQASSDRALRKAPLVQIAGIEAGAIHSSNVLVTVSA